ncbi:hypothetical protein NIES2135_27320 [Leptolyngbya boryana NIES-2135]|jgi:hypothetical protein|uniref:Uncharacterized protein n=1 Tax=Leptolyngbya boryana NIES-2135 TaxID=1973484 RepID=A0A1Z4JHA4_LEPBY|nr:MULTISPECIES: hypothetical protein [Leptolyngbya]BAY55907.1 hypothetical protein NIES2135_27320 [Leptolyngbya boryana NIES-2135]MBD2368792.1 hypothetical protein [Leptolyngbya sp. FACHB-161]MBD2375340.1 hypothetical protein [Leptolyngbya sp. FACHB-238]MBD2399758.1 hypothetical protein [Leptolyngbya sp. FACHB-239]MBD2405964.1 hypothetical protein [Leptolyngbya sp. FACHB-402]
MKKNLPKSACPSCGYVVDAATGVGHNEQPKPGSYGICLRCSTSLIYTESLTVRAATFIELERLKQGNLSSYQAMQYTIAKIREEAANRN